MRRTRIPLALAPLILLSGVLAAADEPTDVLAAEFGVRPPEQPLLRLTGVVTGVFDDDIDPDWVWLAVRDTSGTATVAVRKSLLPMTNALSIVDAEISVTGTTGGPQAYRRTVAAYICLTDTPPVIHTPAPDWNDIPYHSSRRDSAHRRRHKGTVAAVTRSAFYLRHGLKVIPRAGEIPPKAGDAVIVAGFFSPSDPGSVVTEAIVRPDPKPVAHTDPPRKAITDVERLFHDSNGRARIDVRRNMSLVRLRGYVAARSESERDGATFELTCGRRTVLVDASAFPEDAADVLPGCRVEVSGVALFEFEREPAGVFPVFQRVSVVPRTASDIRILARPPWWTPQRLSLVIIFLVIVLAALTVLAQMLWKLASRRAKEAYHDRIARAHAESRTAERTRLATDLHDSLAQNLTGVTLQIDAARKARTLKPEALATHLDTAERMLSSCRTELRRCLWDLRYEALDLPDLAEAIRQTVEPVRENAAVTIEVNARRSLLDDIQTHAALSIIRELVSNAVRHGAAKSIRIHGEIAAQALEVNVTDDGCGFNPGNAPGMAEGHFGLVGIRDRLRALGGSIRFTSSAGQGCRAELNIPLAKGPKYAR